MKFPAALLRRLHWIHFPTAALIALLQRTPALRVVATAGEFVLRAPTGSVLKSSLATAVALGAVHSLVGASSSLTASVSSPAKLTASTYGQIAFSVLDAQASPGSFTVGGNVPPGMTYKSFNSMTAGITNGIINASTIELSGVPTSPGSFTLSIRAWQSPNGTGDTALYSYIVNVAAAADSAPVFTTQPTNQSAPVSGAVVFFVVAAGSPSPTYQWRKNGTALSGQTGSSLTLSNLNSTDAGTYTCVATNTFGSVTSNSATLTVTGVGTPPTLSVQPASAAVALGESYTFNVTASGATSYQWRKNSAAISGAVSSSLTLDSISAAHAGSYDVIASNSAGSVTSATATLLVNDGLPNRLSNVAVRTTLVANQILIVGLSVQGGSKNILIRAAGPSLGALGVPGTMANPKLAVFDGPVQEIANDDWAGATPVATAITAVGAFPFTSTTSLDAAVVRSISGGRTVQVSGPTAGNLIVEAYDAGTGHTPRLINLSARNFAGTGNDVLIAGFTVAGPGNKNLLIRAAGPSLGALGVPNTIVDPKLELFSATTPPVKIGENDNYSPTLPTLFTKIGAFPFISGAKDAALMVSLPAGGYTVQVSGADGGTGEAIVEVYELP